MFKLFCLFYMLFGVCLVLAHQYSVMMFFTCVFFLPTCYYLYKWFVVISKKNTERQRERIKKQEEEKYSFFNDKRDREHDEQDLPAVGIDFNKTSTLENLNILLGAPFFIGFCFMVLSSPFKLVANIIFG